ncbi:GDP-fucose transporter-related protein [Histomonas meleagridis]|uniref:GDP-fucose transporter-related protein n=1 Tax=Histomonas meleagridis TaxID=135588 RepID=UPI00355941A3|nr:GDP-fucose transporter-related protein [Histomonas meleagridis]KAH0796301.1 GDP-fucose transporter-related protein [Histomonas meleagridis]
MIGFNNKCLEFVSVSGYQIVRSLTIIFSIILTYIFQKQTTSFRATLACLGVIIGFCMGVKGDLNLTLKGCIYGISSSFFVALYSIMVKRVMGLLDNNEYLLIEYNTPLAIIMLTPVVWYNGEFNVLKERRSLNFWGMQTLAGVVGFIINIAIFLNIKYTTPLTHNLSGTVKACIQTLLAFVFFPKQESMTTQKFIGTVLVIGFSAYYTFVRKAEMKQKIEQEHIKKMEENDQTALLGQDEEKDEEEEEDGNEKPLL